MNPVKVRLTPAMANLMQRLPKTLSPSDQTTYLDGFNAAITLYDQYFEKEKISHDEAKFRVNQIRSVMMSKQKTNSFIKKNMAMGNKKRGAKVDKS